MNIIKSNNQQYIGKQIVLHSKKDHIQIGGGFFSKGIIFSANDVSDFKLIDPEQQHVSTKGIGGTLGTGAIGGLMFGGAGAVLGGLAGGNKVKQFGKTHVALQFSNNDWVVIEYDTSDGVVGWTSKLLIEAWQKRYAEKQDNPFSTKETA